MGTWLSRTLEQSLRRTARALEARRIRTRLLMVCAALEHKPALADPALAAARRRNLAELRAYALRGRFPLNRGVRGAMTPFIKDAAGTLCAVAHMVARSGHRPLVEALARDCNNIRVPDVVDGPLLDWLARSGLTQAEAALIQVPYMPMEPHASTDLAFQVVTQAAPSGLGQLQLSLIGLAVFVTAYLAVLAYRRSRPVVAEREEPTAPVEPAAPVPRLPRVPVTVGA